MKRKLAVSGDLSDHEDSAPLNTKIIIYGDM